MATIGKKTPNDKTTTMSKTQKQVEQPSIRDTARSFAEAIIAERKAFERMNWAFRRARKKVRKNQSR